MSPTEEYIRQLLERYYQGTTSREEERQLKAYFAQDDVPPALAAEREMFRYFSHNARQMPPVPEGLEERLAHSIDQRAAEQRRTRHAPLRRTHLWQWTAGIAASLLLASAIGLHLHTQHNAQPHDTFDDPQLAYAEASRALRIFDATFDKGEQQMDKAKEATREVQQKLEKYRIILNQ